MASNFQHYQILTNVSSPLFSYFSNHLSPLFLLLLRFTIPSNLHLLQFSLWLNSPIHLKSLQQLINPFAVFQFISPCFFFLSLLLSYPLSSLLVSFVSGFCWFIVINESFRFPWGHFKPLLPFLFINTETKIKQNQPYTEPNIESKPTSFPHNSSLFHEPWANRRNYRDRRIPRASLENLEFFKNMIDFFFFYKKKMLTRGLRPQVASYLWIRRTSSRLWQMT